MVKQREAEAEVRKIAHKRAGEAVEVLLEMLRDPRTSPAMRVAAAGEILKYAERAIFDQDKALQ